MAIFIMDCGVQGSKMNKECTYYLQVMVNTSANGTDLATKMVMEFTFTRNKRKRNKIKIRAKNVKN